MSYLSGCVVSLGDRKGVGLVQLIIEGVGIMVTMDVVGGIYYDAPFVLALDKPD